MKKTKKQEVPSLTSRIGKGILRWSVEALYILFIVFFAVTEGQQVHLKYLRHKVSKNVVMIKDVNRPNGGGGTGFHVRAPSGKTYILTNHHVCNVGTKDEDAQAGRDMLVLASDGSRHVRRIVATYPYNDLCLLEGIDGVKGLSVSSSNDVGDIVSAVGHPHLRPVTMTRGELVAETYASSLWKTANTPQGCGGFQTEAYRLTPEEQKYLRTKNSFACIRTTDVMLTTVQVLPGSSGSPVVDYTGSIVGVVYLGMTDNNWSGLVPLKHIRKFLKDY